MGTRTAHSKRDGFTILEAMVALLVLSLSFAGSMSLMTAMLRANAFSLRTTTAVSLAQDTVDDLMNQPYDQVASGTDTVSIYQRAWTVKTGASMKSINVAVTWSSVDGDPRLVSLSTMIDDKD